MLKFLRNHIALAVIALLLVTTGLYTLLPSGREVFYEMHPVFTLCRPAAGGTACAARMEVNVGNTGEAEESVTLAWPHFEGGWTSGYDFFDISADRPRSHDPVVSCETSGGRRACAIDRFAPGALMVMHIDCIQCSKREVRLLQKTPLEIHTEARAVRGNPRVTLLLRRLTAFAQLF